MNPVAKRSSAERDPATAVAGESFPGEENPQKVARVSEGTLHRRGGFGSDPSRATPGIGPVAESAGGVLDQSSGDADVKVGAGKVTVSKAVGEGSSSVVAGIGPSVQALSEAVTPRAPVPVQMTLARGPQPQIRWMNGLKIGDMVWGKVKTHPWWPGYIFNSAFATSDVRRTRKPAHVLVAFFGDNSYGWFIPGELLHFAPHFLEKKKQTTSKNFLKAVAEAQDEVRRRVALGMSCRCRNPRNFRDFGFPSYVRVDLPGYERGAEYSWKQIENARNSFEPKELLSFLQQLSVAPRSVEPKGIDFISGVARALAYRKAVFADNDETFPLAHGVEPVRSSDDDDEEEARDHELRFFPPGSYFAPGSRSAPRDITATTFSGQLTLAPNVVGVRLTPSPRPAAKAPKAPAPSKKRTYVLKRRDEQKKRASSGGVPSKRAPLPTLRLLPALPWRMTAAVPSSSSPKGQAPASSTLAGNYVLQKRPQLTLEGSKACPDDSNMGMAMTSQTLAFDDRTLNGEPVPTDGRMETEPRQLDASRTDFVKQMTGPDRKQNGEPVPTDGRMETEPRQLDVSRTNFVTQVTGPDRKLNGEPVPIDGRMETEPRQLDVSRTNFVKQVTGPDRKLNGEPVPTDGRMETEPRRLDVSRTNSVKQVTGPPLVLPAPAGRAVEQGSKPQAVTTVDGLAKKKARKRLSEDSGLVGSGDIQKKKRKKVLSTDDNGDIQKKKKKVLGTDDNEDIQKKKKKNVLGTEVGFSRDGGESRGKLAGKSIGLGLGHGEIGRIESQRDAGVVRVSDLSSAAAQPPRADPSSLGMEFPDLLSDLRVLAVDPLFGTERDAPKLVLQVFCKFRRKVYLKSLPPPAIAELHAARVAAGRSLPAPAAAYAGIAFGKKAKDRREPPSASLTPPAIAENHAARVAAGRSLPAPAAGNAGIAFGKVANRRKPPPSASLTPPAIARLHAPRVAAGRSLLATAAGNACISFGKEAKDRREPPPSASLTPPASAKLHAARVAAGRSLPARAAGNAGIALSKEAKDRREPPPSASLIPPAIAELHAARVAAGRSLLAPAAGNAGIALGKEAKDCREPPPSALKPLKPRPDQDDLAKAGLKRGPSDRLEELHAKKAKIMNQLKALTALKNAGISQKMPEGQQRSQKEPPTKAAAAMKPSASAKPGEKAAAEAVKKQNPPVPPRASSPTAMVLKYPRTVTLPSIPGLKAKLAWFGPLVEGGTRVRWKSYTCQVVFQHKPDAQAAAMYVNKNDHLLGRNVRCSLIEVDPATLEPLINPRKPRPPASRPSVGPPPRRGKDGAESDGSLTPPRASPHRQPPAPAAPLKSILKKPGSLSAAGPPSSLPPPPPLLLHSSLSSSTPTPPPPPPLPQPVHSSLSSSTPPPPPPLPLLQHSSLSSSTPPPPPPPPLPLHSSLSSSTPPPPLPLPLHSSLSSSTTAPPPPPPPPPPPVVVSQAPPSPPLPLLMVDGRELRGPAPAELNQPEPQQNRQQAGSGEGNGQDFRNEMLALMVKCSQIVAHVTSTLGYLPYHPL